MKKHFFFGLFFSILIGCSRGTVTPPVIIDKDQLSQITVEDLEGHKVPLLANKAKITLVHFWASWCFVCPPEMEELSHLYDRVKDLGVEIVGVATSDTPAGVRSFIKKHPISFPLVLDSTGDAWMQFALESVPGTVFFDDSGKMIQFPDPQDGTLRDKIDGPRGWESAKVVRALEKLIKSP